MWFKHHWILFILLRLEYCSVRATYCTPGSSCFPSDATLSVFNRTIGGRLIKTVPYAAVCYAGAHYDAAKCAELVQNQGNGKYRHELPDAVMYTNWELGGEGLRVAGGVACITPASNADVPLTGACAHGSLAPYIINATSTAGVENAAVCFAGAHYDNAKCAELVQNQGDREYQHEISDAVRYTNWELDGAGFAGSTGCITPATVPNAPLTGTCTHGSLAPYVVNATSAADIVEAVKFASLFKLRLRVKNSGHCYTGRSTAPGSFTIWTHYLQGTRYDAKFVPEGCVIASQPAIVAGTGVDVLGLYTVADKFNRSVIGGFTPTVGAAGGYIIGGGTGLMSNRWGLGVDNVLQFETVTPDGVLRINACKNSDLFWALRGGGGAFGVNTRVWIKAHEPYQAVNSVFGALIANDTETYATIIRTLVDTLPSLYAHNISGIWQSRFPGVAILFTQLFVDSTPIPDGDTYAVFDKILSIPGIKNAVRHVQHSRFLQTYTDVIVPTIERGSLVGLNLLDMSRTVSNDLIHSATGRKSISDYIVNLPASIPFIFQVVGGGAVNVPKTTETAVHPAWRSAFGFVDMPVFGPVGGITVEQIKTLTQVRDAADPVFGKVAYYNEDVPGEENWQESFFGSNYPRLLALKKKYDPHGVISCRQCVGSEIFGY